MATVRDGNQDVLIVVDVQAGVMANAFAAERVIGNVARAVDQARRMDVPVIWVQHEDGELIRDSPAWQWVPGLVPDPHEPLVHKRHNSSFEDTSLEATLAELKATHITLAGAATNWCIRSTAFGALERGYDVTLVEDAHSTEDMVLADGTIVEAARVIDDLNIAMTWMSYPGRSNTTATTAALFTATKET